MRSESDSNEKSSTSERVYALSDQMLALSVTERRRRWKTYLARVTVLSKESERSEEYEVETVSLETRDESIVAASHDADGHSGSSVESESWERARHYRARYEEAHRAAQTATIETRDDFMLFARARMALADAFEASLATKKRVGRPRQR